MSFANFKSGLAKRVDREATTSRSRTLGTTISELALPFFLIVFIAFFTIAKNAIFWSLADFRTIASTQAVLCVLALGTMIPLVVGEFDLSVAYNLGLGAIVVAALTANVGLPTWLAIVLAILVCTGVGALNGFLVAKLKVHAFVATLAMGIIISGVMEWMTGGASIAVGIPMTLIDLGIDKPFGVPITVVYLLVIAAVLFYLFRYTPTGRYMYAIGGSKEAALLSGVNTTRMTFLAFVGAGFCAGIAGSMEVAIVGSASPTMGPDFLLPAFAACYLGATSIRPGTFNVLGTVIAVYTIAVGTTGLELMGVPSWIEPIFSGIVLILAALAGRYIRKTRQTR